jgi:hypothetical protein
MAGLEGGSIGTRAIIYLRLLDEASREHHRRRCGSSRDLMLDKSMDSVGVDSHGRNEALRKVLMSPPLQVRWLSDELISQKKSASYNFAVLTHLKLYPSTPGSSHCHLLWRPLMRERAASCFCGASDEPSTKAWMSSRTHSRSFSSSRLCSSSC